LINNRQSGRRRGRGGGNSQRPQGGGGRPDNGNRIDNRARGNAAQLLEKYRNLAADAQRQGDRVNTEYYLQFADHYFRVLSETRARQEEAQGQQQRRPQPADPFRDQFGEFESEDDFADEGEAIRPGEQMMAQSDRGDGLRRENDRRENDQRADRPERADRSDRREDRSGDQRADQRGERRPRFDRERPERSEQPRHRQPRAPQADAGEQGGRPFAEENGDQEGRAETIQPQPQYAAPPAQPVTEQAAAVEAERASDVPAEAPRRRGRPRRVEAAPVSDESPNGGVEGLPPAIGLPSVANDADEEAAEAPKPRRRRTPRAAAAPAAE